MHPLFCSLVDIDAAQLLNGIPHGIALFDRELRLVFMNQFLEGLSGYALADVKGVEADCVLRSNVGNRGRAFREILDMGELTVLSGDMISRDRRKLPMQFTFTPLRAQSEGPVGLMVALDDLSASISTGVRREANGMDGIIGQSAKMQEVFDLIPLLAKTEASVLITGETGTGKDKVAEAIHQQSGRGKMPFIKINCGALPESLLESELFGYVKGAFTGAVKDKSGMFRLAQGGTLFLTEIGDMPIALQVKLLSVLDDREFFPLGGEKKVAVDVRIIAATHRSLKEGVARGAFREDLYYRLNVLHLHLPPLRERETDTRFLLNHFLRLHAEKSGSPLKSFSRETLELLMGYSFPGNIRELRNIVEYCVHISPQGRIEPEHLPKHLLAVETAIHVEPETKLRRHGGEIPLAPETAATSKVPSLKARQGGWLGMERELILQALTETRGNRSRAAALLGWGRTTLWRKLKLHGLVEEAEDGRTAQESP